jgi:hypothetical protein
MAEITRSQRQRLVTLMQRDRDGTLTPGQRTEMVALQQLGGINGDAPMRLVRQWADTGWDTTTPQRSMSGRRALLETLAMRFPRQPMSGRQAVVELLRMRGEWTKTPKQIELERMRERWT